MNCTYNIIYDLVPENGMVLDLGCGHGELLQALVEQKKARGHGVEIDPESVMACMRKGLSVFQGNLDEGLKEHPDNAVDTVILNQTLQSVHNTELVLSEMLRVGRTAIVGIPNFAHWRVRLQLGLTGRLPVTHVYKFEWYNTPNIRLTTIRDFKAICEKINARVVQEFHLSGDCELSLPWRLFPNMVSETAIFVLQKN
jgi:methionine biosynthesis protein MetW